MPTIVPPLPSMRRDTTAATRVRMANVRLRKALEAQSTLEALGCTVTWPAEPHESIADATINR